MMDQQKLLDWLNNEKKKDSVEVEKIKKDFENKKQIRNYI